MSARTGGAPAPALALVVGLAVGAGMAIAGAELTAIIVAAVCAGVAWLVLALLHRRH
jgi:tetrahydromethanopterin S-methyltransferase subunit D